METFLTREDFNLVKEYEVFDILYSVAKTDLSVINEWCVVGHTLNTSANKRCYQYFLVPHPISSYVMKNNQVTLSSLKNVGYVAKSKIEVVELARAEINKNFTLQLDKLNEAVE